MSKLTKAQQAERSEAIEKLRSVLTPGQTVYTILRHVSKSGMQRRISLRALDLTEREPSLTYLDHWVARATGWRLHKDGGIVVDGCGMDMGFHLVYVLGRTLWPSGTPEPHGVRGGKPDNDGGYALHHEWI